MSILSERLSLIEDRMEDIALQGVPACLAGFILRLIDSEGVVAREGYKIPTCYTRWQLATMVGSKRETVTKAFTLLQRAGVVDLRRRRIYVRDIEALKRATQHEPLPTPVP